MEETMNWLSANWEVVLLFFFVCEKIVKISPTKADDIIVDIIFKGLMEKLGKSKKEEQS